MSLLFRAMICASLLAVPSILPAQGNAPRTPRADSMRTANRLDTQDSTAAARAIFAALIESAPDAAAKVAAQRAMAISYAFTADCGNAGKYEEMAIAYWATQEQADPQNAFNAQGEIANEAGRICIDAGDLAGAERWYRRGTEYGMKEPEPRTHAKSLWEFRMHHAMGRLAARRGDKAAALQHVAMARKTLDADTALAGAQERFFPYLQGYVALYTGDLAGAEAALTKAISLQGNQADPFLHALLGMTAEKQGNAARAREFYQKTFDMATAHNPPAGFARPFARKKLATP